MPNESDKGKKKGKKTGLFYVKDPIGVVVMYEGEEVYRYKSVEEFVETHIKGMAALEKQMEATLAQAYKDI